MLSDAAVHFLSIARSWLRGRTGFTLQFEGLSISKQELAWFYSIMPVVGGAVAAGSSELCAIQKLYSES